jgi:rhodanese-related sulfurtransferase
MSTKKLLVGFLTMIGFLSVIALSSPIARAQDDEQFSDPTVKAAPVQLITPADVLKLMQSKDESIALVDTQPVDGYAEGHILGAVNYPWVMQIKKFPIDLPRNKTLIMYGSCPNDTSDMVAKLAQFGYVNVKVMDGGWYKWLELKYPSFVAPNAPETEPSKSQSSMPQSSMSQQSVSQLTGAPPRNDKPVTHAK